ncbi:helix-turn-helix transcriptional regulator [Paraburkholderia sp. B3]|uniref:helix-turn-helix transcriptional regulator n=1 Tax=Paraburkholderia sp. B3 TaxID=3134791 RepID=UPI0039821380
MLPSFCDAARGAVRVPACGAAALTPALDAGVSALAQLVRPSATVFYRIGEDQEPSGFELFGMAEAMHRTWLRRYCPLDPMHPSRFAAQPANVLTLDSELPATVRGGSIYWQRFLNAYQVVDVMEVLLRDGARPAAAFSLLRMAPAEPFTVDDLGRARAVQPLLEAALIPAVRDERLLHVAADGPRLTHREQQIAQLVRDGHANKAIARALDLSQPTVKTHLLRMYRKLGVSSRTELIGMLFL